MKKTITAIAAVFACVSLTGCMSDELATQQKAEDQALNQKHSAERQVERANQLVDSTSAAKVAAEANLAVKEGQKAQATTELQALVCPAVPD